MAVRVEVLNSNEVREALARLPAQVEEMATQAVADAVEAVETNARNDAPVDQGDLRDSIVGLAQGLSGVVEVGEHYGQFVEFGTSSQTAQPFLLPAAEGERARFEKRIRDAAKGLGK